MPKSRFGNFVTLGLIEVIKGLGDHPLIFPAAANEIPV